LARGPASSSSAPRQAVADAAATVSKWYRAYQGFVAAAAKVSQLISFCCGVWLVLTAPFAIIGSAITMRIPDAILCAFLGAWGLLMMGMELPLNAVQRVLQQYFFFAYTRPGRGLLVTHVAVIAWACKHVGAMTKALMAFNAGLTFYILNSQDRRFAKVDSQAQDALAEAAEEMRGSVGEALSFGKMMGSFGGFAKGKSKGRGSAPLASDSASGGGGFSGFDSSPFPDSSAPSDPQSSWPSGSGHDA